jgi:hypothetical protein
MGINQGILSGGSQIKQYASMHASLYAANMDILGNTGTIIPFCDPFSGNPTATSFTSVGSKRVQFNSYESGSLKAWSNFSEHNALADSDTFPYVYRGIIPIVKFGSLLNFFEINADAAYWSRGNGTVDYPFSLGCWVNLRDKVANEHILSKWLTTTGLTKREWYVSQTVTTGVISLFIFDESAAVSCKRATDSAAPTLQWVFLTFTYNGVGGASAGNGIIMYVNGASVASTATNNGSYVAMEDTTTKVVVGASTTTTGSKAFHYKGQMAGGPLGPFYVQKELTADDIKLLYEIGRRSLAL